MQVKKTEFSEIAALRDLFRAEAGCQIVRDSILPRGLADPFVVLEDSLTLGYAGVWNRHFPGRLMEFFVVPDHRDRASECFAAVLGATATTACEAQTNLALQHRLVLEHVTTPVVENLLFGEGGGPPASRPDLSFRPRRPSDVGPEGEWVVESSGAVVGAGGLLHHYNPPYADLFMEVVPEERGRGLGSFLVQELRRVCREAGGVPAARCDPTNEASRRTLLRGGLVHIGELVAAPINRHVEWRYERSTDALS